MLLGEVARGGVEPPTFRFSGTCTSTTTWWSVPRGSWRATSPASKLRRRRRGDCGGGLFDLVPDGFGQVAGALLVVPGRRSGGAQPRGSDQRSGHHSPRQRLAPGGTRVLGRGRWLLPGDRRPAHLQGALCSHAGEDDGASAEDLPGDSP